MAMIPVQIMFSSTVRGFQMTYGEVDEVFWASLTPLEQEAYLAGEAEKFAHQFAQWRAYAVTPNMAAASTTK